MSKTIKKINLEDLEVLKKISSATFLETFGEQNDEEEIKNYLAESFSNEKLEREIQNQYSEFYFIYKANDIAGYLKVNIEDAQTEDKGSRSLEVERIYILHKYSRLGLGRILIEKAIERAAQLGKEKIWLGVWEENHQAIKFYSKFGFVRIGSHTFMLGSERQVDLILEKILKGE